MSTIRPLATIAILAVVGVFLADKINKGPVATVTSESDWGAGNSAESTGGEVAPPSFSPTVAGDPSATPGVVSGVPPIGHSPLVETPGSAANPETASVLAPPTAIAIDPPEVPPLPPLPPAGGVTSNDPAGGAMGAPSPAAPPVTPSITPVDPLANLPLPDNIPAASYDASPTAAASMSPNTMPPKNPPPAVEGRVYGLPPEPSATASLPPAPPAASPAAPPVVPPGLPPLNPQVTPPSAPGGYSLAKPAIDAALARNELSRALLLLSSWRGDPTLTAAERQEVDTLLGQLAGSVIYSNDHLLEGPYTVRPGETLETIAQRHGVPWQLLGKINGVADPMAVTPGQTLKVVRGPFRATVDLSDGELCLLIDGRYAGRFPVQLDGAATTEGQWRIEKKQQTAGKQLVLSGAAGPAFGQQVVLSGSAAGSPPGAAGKIAVADRDLDDLFDILSVGSEVVVRR